MKNLEEFVQQLMPVISCYSVEDYKEGLPYIRLNDMCESYEEYQYGCNILDSEGMRFGIDPMDISLLHSTFERLYYSFIVKNERAGSNSWRNFKSMNNAAPGHSNSLGLWENAPHVIFPSYFMVAEGKIYRQLPPNCDWGVISTTIFCPIAIYYNIEKKTEVYKIAYRWHDQVHTFECLPSEIHDLKYILKFADRGIHISMNHAKYIREFIEAVISMNRGNAIAEIRTTDRIGWIDYEGLLDFVPFSSLITYSGEHNNQNHVDGLLKPAGTLENWIKTINQFRDKNHIHARLVLAASFASILVKRMGALPFVVDVWGGESGSGKSVSIMTAASVWAKPGIDDGYIKKVDGTIRSLENDAAQLNNLPLCLDETQTIDDRKKFDNMIYNLCSGISHGAMAANKKRQEEKYWSNCIILSGEQPIVTEKSLAGSTNRVIDIECPPNLFFVEKTKFPEYCKALRENYGTAGRKFVDKLCKTQNYKYAEQQYKIYLEALQHKTTGKQASSFALILTADKLVGEWIFKDDLNLSIDDLLPFIKDEESVNTNERAHQIILEWIATNRGKFEDGRDRQYGRFGTRSGRKTCEIVRSSLADFLQKNGFDIRSYLSWAKSTGKIYYGQDKANSRSDVVVSFNGTSVRMICIFIAEKTFKQ